MAKILYCEDETRLRDQTTLELVSEFPKHKVVSTAIVRDGLAEITGVDIHPKYLKIISPETIEKRLRDSNANLSDLGIVITDGGLIDPFAGAGDSILEGWDLAQILRNLGYRGKIVYVGLTSAPVGKQSLFDVTLSKFDNQQIVDYVRKHLP